MRTPAQLLLQKKSCLICAGAHVARLELGMAFKHLLPRIAEVGM